MEGIAKRYSIELMERALPTDLDVTACVAERVTVLLEAQLRTRDKLKTERMQRFVPFIAEWSASEEGQALLAMLLDDFYQQSLHAPPLPPANEKLPQRGERTNRSQPRSQSRSEQQSEHRSERGSQSSGQSSQSSRRGGQRRRSRSQG